MEEPKLYFISGSSGVGKSTIVPLLQSALPEGFDVHDFDEKLTKEVAMNSSQINAWRQDTSEYWVKFAENNDKHGKSTIVLGLVYHQEVLDIKSIIPIKFILLDVSSEKIQERLMGKRFSTTEKVAALMLATGQTQEGFMEENKVLIDKLRHDARSANCEIIDTTGDSPKETASKILKVL